MRVYCFYHRSDWDGICSGALVNLYEKDVTLVGVEYSDKVLVTNNHLTVNGEHYDLTGSKVYIVDFCFDKFVMNYLTSIVNVILIDHHKHIVNDPDYRDLDGLRTVDHAACYLTYQYLYKQRIELNDGRIPYLLDLLDRYDRYVKDGTIEFLDLATDAIIEKDIWTYEVLPLQYALKVNDVKVNDKNTWDNLLQAYDRFSQNQYLYDTIEIGQVILNYNTVREDEFYRDNGFTCKFEGYTAACFNTYSNELADRLLSNDSVDLVIMFFRSDDKWIHSLRSKKVDVSIIAKKYGGGGHPRAAGFTSPTLLI